MTADALSPSSGGGSIEGLIAVINPAVSTNGLVYASYLTSPGYQIVYGVDIDASGNLYVAGVTTGMMIGFQSHVGKYSGFFLVLKFPAGNPVKTPPAGLLGRSRSRR